MQYAFWIQSELISIRADGSERMAITNNTWLDQGPVISPDGTKIAYTSCDSGNREVWIMQMHLIPDNYVYKLKIYFGDLEKRRRISG